MYGNYRNHFYKNMFTSGLADIKEQNDRMKYIVKRDILKTVTSPTAKNSDIEKKNQEIIYEPEKCTGSIKFLTYDETVEKFGDQFMN